MVEDAVEGGPGDSFETAVSALGDVANPQTGRAESIRRSLAAGKSEPTLTPASRPPYYWTWRLLSQGFPAEECLAIRGITRETLLDHVLQAAESGLEIRSSWCLSAEMITALDTVVGDSPPKQIRPLLAQLPPGTRYEEVQVYLKCRSY